MNNNKPIIIISSVILILIVVVIYMFTSGGSGDDDFSDNFMSDNTEENFSYDDLMNQNNGNYFDGKNANDNDELVELDIDGSGIDNLINDTAENFYSNEDDEIIKQIEREIAEQNKPTRTTRKRVESTYTPKKQNTTQTAVQSKKEESSLGDRVDVNQLNNYNNNSSSSYSSFIKVKIFEDKKVTTGSIIKLITTESIVQNGINIPLNTILTGIVDVNQNRVKITVNSIRTKSGLISCNLKAFDLNGNEGLLTNNKQIQKEAVSDASNESGTIIKTPVADISKDIFQKKMNANTVSLKRHTNLVLK